MTYQTVYTVVLDDEGSRYQGLDLEQAIRDWDLATHTAERVTPGGILVQTFDGDTMVRDGWILHVRRDGTVYLHPRLIEREGQS